MQGAKPPPGPKARNRPKGGRAAGPQRWRAKRASLSGGAANSQRPPGQQPEAVQGGLRGGHGGPPRGGPGAWMPTERSEGERSERTAATKPAEAAARSVRQGCR